jgi:HPt (histidine-containing phosphotransfer) domain-containing protein
MRRARTRALFHVLVPQTLPSQSLADFEPPVFDRLIDDIGRETAFEALSLFLTETGSQLRRMSELLASGDRTRLKREAHSLKSASATLGFLGMSAAAKHVESVAETLAVAELLLLLPTLDRQFLAACRAAPRSTPESPESDGHP